MSQVTDSQGNILNAPGPGCGRYTDDNSTTIDWFATHPRPVEELKTPIEVSIGDWFATHPRPVEELKTPIEVSIGEEIPATPAAPAAGVTTSSLPQTAVTE